MTKYKSKTKFNPPAKAKIFIGDCESLCPRHVAVPTSVIKKHGIVKALVLKYVTAGCMT